MEEKKKKTQKTINFDRKERRGEPQNLGGIGEGTEGVRKTEKEREKERGRREI